MPGGLALETPLFPVVRYSINNIKSNAKYRNSDDPRDTSEHQLKRVS